MRLLVDFDGILARARAVFAEKSAAYGTHNIAETGETGVVIRMIDKFARIRNKGIPGEAIDDVLVDLINYSAILLLLRGGKWPGVQSTLPLDADVTALRVLAVGSDGISAPQKAGDVGFDLCAAVDVAIQPMGGSEGSGSPTYVPTGVCVKAPDGVWLRMTERSSTAMRGLILAGGTIDNGYTGELLIPLVNLSGRIQRIQKGERLAQLICCPVVVPKLTVVDALPETARGATGFGSTGQKKAAPVAIAPAMPQNVDR